VGKSHRNLIQTNQSSCETQKQNGVQVYYKSSGFSSSETIQKKQQAVVKPFQQNSSSDYHSGSIVRISNMETLKNIIKHRAKMNLSQQV
jgi:hypothetical protein